MSTVDRAEMLTELADELLAVQRSHPVRVAIDGCSASGKTTLGGELAGVLRARTGREIIRAGIDYFKRAPELRTAYPIDSAESYYLDMWDYDAVRNQLLRPLGPDGDRGYVVGVRDSSARTVLDSSVQTATPEAVLLADGAFLQRPELDDHWDFRIYVHVSFETVLRRGTERDQQWMDSAAVAEQRYQTRYIPGERMYVDEVRPADRAEVVVDNEDPASPIIIRRAVR
jgi:uridine kinase